MFVGSNGLATSAAALSMTQKVTTDGDCTALCHQNRTSIAFNTSSECMRRRCTCIDPLHLVKALTSSLRPPYWPERLASDN